MVRSRPYSDLIRVFTAMMPALVLSGSLALAVQMKDDPKGFEGVPWGVALSESDLFKKVEEAGRVKGYEFKGAAPSLGQTQVQSMRFTTIDEKFARVTVRYEGKAAYDQILAFLQTRYGEIDRTPGQFAGGAVKIFTWRGTDTDVTMRYETRTDRGIIFFENPSLASRLEGAMAPEPDLGGATY
jgi:hypothetical protein